jgi:hypothetical protein
VEKGRQTLKLREKSGGETERSDFLREEIEAVK